jgi:hypothetical protein
VPGPADAAAVRRFLRELGRIARGPATVYLVGGATAVLEGWRPTTIDVDLRIEPEVDDVIRKHWARRLPSSLAGWVGSAQPPLPAASSMP